jgi:cation:H+ antiporter
MKGSSLPGSAAASGLLIRQLRDRRNVWGAEAARMDISGSLAIAILAVIAVLPEYAVDLYFAYTAGSDPSYVPAANMTGSNRLLLGLGWSVVAFIVPLSGQIHLVLRFALLGLFAFYLWKVSRAEAEEPELVGPAARIGALPARVRRPLVLGLFLFAAAVILASAEPFAHSLIETGAEFGLDEFLLVQWLAPLASEAPEFIVAILFAVHGRGSDAIGTLISSKVNQWTLLVGSLAIAYLLAGVHAARAVRAAVRLSGPAGPIRPLRRLRGARGRRAHPQPPPHPAHTCRALPSRRHEGGGDVEMLTR